MIALTGRWTIVAAATAVGAIFLADLLTPLGIAVPMLYVYPILLTRPMPGSAVTSVLAGCSLVLTWLGVSFSTGEFTFAVAADRTLSSALLLVVTSLVLGHKRSVHQIAMTELERDETKEQFRAFAQATNDVVYRMSPDWTEMRYLQGQKFIADTIEPSRTWLDKYIHQDDQQLVMNTIQQAIQSKNVFELEHRVIRMDHSLGWAYSRAIPILDHRGDIIEWFGAARDVTPRKRAEAALRESEERFRKVFEDAAEGIAIADMAGNMVMCNAAYTGITGYSQEELVTQQFSLLIHPDDRTENLEMVRQLREEDRASFEVENRYLTKSGKSIWVRKHVSLLRNNEGIPMFLVKMATDITQRKLDEDALHRQQERLEDLAARLLTAQEDERRRIAGELHDDLTQRMATLTIDLQSLGRSTSESETALTPRLHRAGKTAEQITTDLQRLAHQLHSALLEHAGLDAAVHELVEEFETRTGVKVNVVVRSLPAILTLDRATCLYRVLQECLQNVRKHAKASEVHVRLLGMSSGVELYVQDDGCGFDATQERTEGRKGLGLISLRERLLLLNGTFHINAKPGHGTEVHVWIPLNHEKFQREGGTRP